MNIENKLKLSQKTFDTWKSVPFKDKQKLLKKLAKVLDCNAEQFEKHITK